MSVNDIVLLAVIVLMLLFAVYDEFIVNTLKGKTQLRIKLRRNHRADAVIFILLIGIVIYNNITGHGSPLTTYLLSGCIIIAIYLAFIRSPKLYFKQDGFFYANAYIKYDRIKTMNLSEDGILLVGLENRKIYVKVTHLDDLQKIYNFMINNK
ncbi:DUF986 domain-containing protein [Morganella morganii subsp. morganii]|uniref:DUF986 family protein n=1 Tax=Morganella morganii TaxID=582 RepID=UPI000DFEF1F0|nr:DUF986 family protein [Morganella morganii]QCY21487.1 DUF986 domain-containing protein [Morganella morganii subsp. morganii]STZ12816.1 Predicted membrane protein [Morganella morganii]